MAATGGLRHDGDEENFVIVPRPTVRDENLSLRSLGLLTYLLDLPAGWDVNAKRLERQVKEGREAIYAALRELRAAGYYRIEKRRAEGGRWVTGTAVAKTARPSWAAEYRDQEVARLSKREEPVPVWEAPEGHADQAPVTEGEDPTAPSEVREAVPREAVAREPGARKASPSKEHPPRRTEDGERTTDTSSSHLGNARGASRPPRPPTAEFDPAPVTDGGPPAQLGGRGHQEWQQVTERLRKKRPDGYGQAAG